MATPPNTTLQPESYQQLLSDMLSSYASSTGIASPAIGSANLSFFQVVSLAIARASGDVFQTLLNSSIQYATGPNLQLIAAEFQITPTESAVATGAITITDTSFKVVSTSIYQGAMPVNIGSTVIYVGSITGFPTTGSIYIGRGTNDSEGPIGYSSTAAIGNYFQINLSSPTVKYHNLGESVILSQGGVRTVGVNTIVIAPGNGLVASQQYTVTQTASILDGANTVTNVPITALLPGSVGNVAANTIVQFASPPFPNATCTNPNPTSSGTDPETDDALRTQILQKLASIGLGTATAIENSLIGVSATTEAATITSVNLVNNLDGTSTVYIAAGNVPYEAKTAGVAIEHIVDVAVGGEKFFQLATGGSQAPVSEAFVQSTDTSPFAIYGGQVLAVTVGGITTQHTFLTSDFQAPGAATAYEICASLNADSTLNFQATTAGSGTYVVLSATSLETHEGIQVTVPASPTAVNANNFLGFPTTLQETLWLYKNDTLLSEDGNTASVLTQEQSLWSNTITNGDTLILTVDNTAPITYTFLNSDFIATGLYSTVNATNSLASWVEVFNNKLTGVTASIVGTQIELTSNSGYTTRAEISIDPSSTLATKDMFSLSVGLSSNGSPADYILDRNTAQFQLAVALKAGDNLTAGTQNTRGTVTSALIPGGTATFATEGYIWIAIDEPVIPIQTGAISGSFITVSKSGSTVSYQSNTAEAFSLVLPGDYVIVWSAQLSATNRLEGRVHSITTTTNTNDTLNILVTAAEAAAVVPQSNIQIVGGFVVARMNFAPQKFSVPAGTNTIDFIATYLQSQTDSLAFTVSLEEYLNVTTDTLNTTGSVTIVTFDTSGSQLNFTAGQTSMSSYPLIAHQDSSGTYMPSFFHSKLSADSPVANPPDSFLTTMTSSISLAGRDPDEILTFLNPYGGIDDEQPENEVVQETIPPTTAINFTIDPDVRRLRVNDRFFASAPLSFGNNDDMVVVMDNNFTNYVFQIPLFRHALTNTTYGIDSGAFNAYDSDFAPTGNFATSFGPGFSFNNYKVLMQAKHILKSTTNQSSILFRSVKWGSTGQEIIVSYIYNSSAPAITSSVTVTNTINVVITVPPSTTASQVVTYVTANLSAWVTAVAVNDGTGGSPGTGIINGIYAFYTGTITGTSTPVTLTAVTSGPNGNSIILTFNGSTSINTAISNWNTANPNNQITLTSGDGTQIPSNTSSAQPSGGIYTSVQLLDGINWILYSNISPDIVTVNGNTTIGSFYLTGVYPYTGILSGATISGTGIAGGTTVVSVVGPVIQLSLAATSNNTNTTLTFTNTGSPQFVFKRPLAYPSDGTGYAFNNGETIILSPTTVDQVFKFMEVLPVTGLSTAALINPANRDSSLEFSSYTYGSQGYVEVVGGSANGYSFPLQNGALNIDNQYAAISAFSTASSNVLSGQWFYLQAANAQQKLTNFGTNSDVTTTPNSPLAGQTTVSVSGQLSTQLYFGSPRTISGLSGLRFRVEKQGTFVCFSYVNSTSSPQYLTVPVNFTATGGGNLSVTLVPSTNDVIYTALTGTLNFSGLSIGSLATITGLTEAGNNGTFMVTGVTATTLQVTNSNAVVNATEAYTISTFAATTGVQEGDSVIVGAPFSAGNRGTYRVIRAWDDSFWITNPDYVEEEQTLTSNSLTFYPYEATIPGDLLVVSGTAFGANSAGTYPVVTVVSPTEIVVQGLISSTAIFTFTVSSANATVGATYINNGQTFTVTSTISSGTTLISTGTGVPLSSGTLTKTSGTGDATITFSSYTQGNINLTGLLSSFYINEGTPYTGYKHVYLVAMQPGTTNMNEILFDTLAQYEKLNQSAGVEVTALQKLEFPVTIEQGIDGYKYNTGLIQAANQVVYGSPTDPTTYPGVAAAGSDIFIKPPLVLVINDLAIEVRLATGAPFSSIQQQVQSNVAALINGNPIGQSIAISSIIAVCTIIPGIVSVAISSPAYSDSSDLIVVQPDEQTYVIDASSISVSLIQ